MPRKPCRFAGERFLLRGARDCACRAGCSRRGSRLGAAAEQHEHGLIESALPMMSHSAMSTALIAASTAPLRPKATVERYIFSKRYSVLSGFSPIEQRRELRVDD